MPGALQFGVRVRGDDFEGAVQQSLAAEGLGYDFLVVGDQGNNPSLEGWTLGTGIAARTERIRILHGTLNLPWRHPPFLAKMAAALDHISGGRLILCIGAGGVLPFLAADYAALGIEVGTPDERFTSVQDFIVLAHGLWSNEKFTYEGRSFRVEDATCLPKPVNGTMPIWVGAGRPRMFRLIGRLADGWMKNQGWPNSVEEYADMNAIIDKAAVDAGREPSSIGRQLNVGNVIVGRTESEASERAENAAAGGRTPAVAGTPAQVADYFRPVIAVGADTFALSQGDEGSLELFAREVIPKLKG